ncbi:MAG: sn-glycerol-3-phosphate ABC transporter ATP-binding protein UgpC [Chloroflexi bacterium]|nr:sn-glycerol-3-phosphate ABC transporter ATP-binding protein UgpC [Ardenticatenaceae bacterium]MBL1130956.1 sn-glycerol-3-phosphate ABC transporter ATP-binding protein UgpC [Chloroflexota bacterium]NOG37053.1 sn-glycerol-3-phosphate ABC transporter ATP-binding protein UgpC [Chloroflexota bacterium]GIK57033.1 MAG: glycerol-3-phosphate ABC transporter ATP-binding protein [Chloroflexota bacterium]
MAGVTYRHVYKRYGDVTVITDLNMEIADKEFVVFVGPSGCGKSTSLRMLAGLEEVTEGEILIGDRVVNDVPPKDRDIAMVFQSYALYPHMSVYDNMAFGLKLRKTPKSEIDRRVKEAAESLGLTHLLDRKPKALSGGQRQRVAVGRAIVREPAVFLMDEPLSNLDAKLRVSARAEISQLHRRLGTTFIYVTHDQVEAMTMGDRIAVMSDGLLQQIDSPRNLYNYPGNVFVAGFIGSPAMNFFDATLVSEEGKLFVDTGDFRVHVPEDRQQPYNNYVGKEVIFGMRPENLHAPQFAPPGIDASPIEGIVEVVELLGHELHLYVNAGKNSMVATVDTRLQVNTGNQVQLVMDMHNMHLFDKKTELAIR